jgi:hypothetical protein
MPVVKIDPEVATMPPGGCARHLTAEAAREWSPPTRAVATPASK